MEALQAEKEACFEDLEERSTALKERSTELQGLRKELERQAWELGDRKKMICHITIYID